MPVHIAVPPSPLSSPPQTHSLPAPTYPFTSGPSSQVLFSLPPGQAVTFPAPGASAAAFGALPAGYGGASAWSATGKWLLVATLHDDCATLRLRNVPPPGGAPLWGDGRI